MTRFLQHLFGRRQLPPSTGPYIRQVPGKWEWVWWPTPLRPGGEDS